MSKSSDNNKKNKGVQCNAENCIHHQGECGCNADCIQVGCPDACSCQETSCSTFRLKDESIGL